MNTLLGRSACFLLPALACGQALAAVELGTPFSDHAVLQRDMPVPVWGTDEVGKLVKVSIQGLEATAVAGPDGRWKAVLPALPVGGPYELTVTGTSTVVLKDILVGEVWLCSGQSNMEFVVKRANNGEEEAAKATNPRIRLLSIKKTPAKKPLDTVPANWATCTPTTAKNFSAVGYFFGRELERELQVPIGLINASWGGTPAQAWTSAQALEASAEFKPLLAAWDKNLADYPQKLKEYKTVTLPKWEKDNAEAKAAGKQEIDKPEEPTGSNRPSVKPGVLYNGMIAPLVPYALRGAIWYQGEANAHAMSEAYRRLLPTMIADWRGAFGRDFSFHLVQLANYGKDPTPELAQPWPEGRWPIIRESQAIVASTVPKCGMAVAIDIGNPANIHPTNKQEVGRRLSLIALAKDYGRTVEFSGPVFKAMTVQGNRAILTFDHAEGLAAKEGALKGFVIAGTDGKFVNATSEISSTTITVTSPLVAEPVAVRYNWMNSPDGNLVNKAGLPAVPFRFPMK